MLLERVKEGKNEMIQLILMGGRIERKIAAGVINVTILSAIMGTVLKFTSHRLIQLATGALLHDIGMVKVPKAILEEEGKAHRRRDEPDPHAPHPFLPGHCQGTEVSRRRSASSPSSTTSAGTARATRASCRGEDINLAARIVAVADSYIAMINNRPHRNSMIGYSAMKNVLSDNGRHFDPKILKVFLESMGIYPIGSIVQLNNSAIGRVVETHSEAPLRPPVELIIDEYGNKRGEREVIDLLTRKGTFIVKAVDPKALAMAHGRGRHEWNDAATACRQEPRPLCEGRRGSRPARRGSPRKAGRCWNEISERGWVRSTSSRRAGGGWLSSR